MFKHGLFPYRIPLVLKDRLEKCFASALTEDWNNFSHVYFIQQ